MGSDNNKHGNGNDAVTSVLRGIALVLCLAVTFVVLEEMVPGEGGASFDHAATAAGGTARSLRAPPLAALADPVPAHVDAHVEEEQAAGSPPPPSEGKELHADKLAAAVAAVERLDIAVRRMQKAKVVMEEDPSALSLTHELQEATAELLFEQYGEGTAAGTYKYELELRFPAAMPDGEGMDNPSNGYFVIETAPRHTMPHAVHTFLKSAARWEEVGGGAFHRNAGHVLQVNVRNHERGSGLAFQEYSPAFPHEKYTLGFAGRPGGAAFYVSTVDNTRNHGPGSQGSKTEADSCFAKVVDGFEMVDRLADVWGHKSKGFKPDRMGFIEDKAQWVEIMSITRVE